MRTYHGRGCCVPFPMLGNPEHPRSVEHLTDLIARCEDDALHGEPMQYDPDVMLDALREELASAEAMEAVR